MQLRDMVKEQRENWQIEYHELYIPDGQGLFKELKPALRFWNPPTMQLYHTNYNI